MCLPWGPLLPFLSTYQKYCQFTDIVQYVCAYLGAHFYLFLVHIKSIVNAISNLISQYPTICVCLSWGPLCLYHTPPVPLLIGKYHKYCQFNIQYDFPIMYDMCVPTLGPTVSFIRPSPPATPVTSATSAATSPTRTKALVITWIVLTPVAKRENYKTVVWIYNTGVNDLGNTVGFIGLLYGSMLLMKII